jgi:hypothetical protein
MWFKGLILFHIGTWKKYIEFVLLSDKLEIEGQNCNRDKCDNDYGDYEKRFNYRTHRGLLSSDSATSSTLEVVASNTVPETDSCE